MLRFLTCMSIAAVCVTAGEPGPLLMPLPVKLETASGGLAIGPEFSAVTNLTDPRLEGALDRLVLRLSLQTGQPVRRVNPADPTHPSLRVECAASGSEYPTLGEDESYQLKVTPEGASISAATVDGAMHGMETFLQLVAPGPTGFQAASVQVEDRPRFPWRGLMLDVSRHWMPIGVVERNLDAMAAVKLNVFHWHLSDDQGFRVESKRYPKLAQFGSDGHYYTQDQIRAVVAYARDRGIRVVPEFDMPGHTMSWFPGYPELTATPGPFEIGRHFGIFDPVLDPSREQTFEFLDTFIGEMAPLFPDPCFHIGGDEVNGKQWSQSPAVQAFAREHGFKDTAAIQLYFSGRVQKILQKHGKTMIGWDEILQAGLGEGTVIQSWRGQASLAESVRQGYRGILSWGYYLDHLKPASYHYGIDPLAGAAAQLTPEQASRILGGEACMWVELADAETVDSRIWPRAAAVAERFWSPQTVTDVPAMYRRMAGVSRELEWTGVEHRSDYEPMLDRLAGGQPAPALRVLANACEALGLGGRHGGRYTTFTPLNRFVDAARPESETVRALEEAASRVAANPAAASADIEVLKAQFTIWAANDASFTPVANGNALLEEVKPLSKDLSALGGAGLKLLAILQGGEAAAPTWMTSEDAELTRMAKPIAEVNLAAVRPVRTLFDAVAARAARGGR
jgi:hexosaminidase